MKNPVSLIVFFLSQIALVSAQNAPSPQAVAGAVTEIAAGMMLVVVLMFVIGILALIFWIFMLIDCVKRKFSNETDKVVWVLIIALLGIIGALVYYFVLRLPHGKSY